MPWLRNAFPGPDGKLGHAEMAWQDAVIMFGPEGQNGGECKAPATTGAPVSFNLYAYGADVDGLFARATAAGATSLMPPQDMFWGDRMCQVADPDGYRWNFATHVGQAKPR
jgi:uncharacterized glyoxalase superfamily protein PhnB